MIFQPLKKSNKRKQYFLSILLIFIVAGTCFLFSSVIGYKTVALLLLVSVSLLAMFFEILPVLCAAILSALLWDYFFIPPHFTFSVGSTEDALMLVMYFIIASVNAVLNYKIRLTEKLASLKEIKENTLKLYATILSSLSHELRTPIATILGATDNLKEAENKLSDIQRDELLSQISESSLRLNRQVENLLNISRLESGVIQARLDWCDLESMLYEIVNHVIPKQQVNRLSIQVAPKLPLVKLDYGLMEQIIQNLIYNALQYTPIESLISITAEIKNEKLRIQFKDHGPGFPENEIKHVFEKFYRLKNSNAGGTGLGLSIVKGFVEAHQGTITLQNDPKGGALFIIDIPAELNYLNHLKNE